MALEIIGLFALATVVLAVGLWLGMLLGRRLDRIVVRRDQEAQEVVDE